MDDHPHPGRHLRHPVLLSGLLIGFDGVWHSFNSSKRTRLTDIIFRHTGTPSAAGRVRPSSARSKRPRPRMMTKMTRSKCSGILWFSDTRSRNSWTLSPPSSLIQLYLLSIRKSHAFSLAISCISSLTGSWVGSFVDFVLCRGTGKW